MKPSRASSRPHRARRLTVRWAPAIVFAVTTVVTGCGSGGTNMVAPPPPVPDTDKTPAPQHAAFDLRFKGVGVLSSTVDEAHTNIDVGTRSQFSRFFLNASGTPLELGQNACSPVECVWFEDTYALPAAIDSLTVNYTGSIVSRLSELTDTLATDTVITSLDVERSIGVYGVSEYITDTLGGYRAAQSILAAPDFASAVSADGAAGRVVTALSFDDDSVRYVSYAWANAAGASYDTQVDTATIASIPTMAQALVDAGYVITAFGGNATNGFLLVGTRVHGSSAAHTLIVSAAPGTNLTGYAVVGYVVDQGGAATILYEN